MSETSAVDELADRATRIYASMGMDLGRGGNGGASESALSQEGGIPALDGLGPVGGGFHSADEFLDLRTLTPRLYLLTELVMDLGQSPPKMKRQFAIGGYIGRVDTDGRILYCLSFGAARLWSTSAPGVLRQPPY